jgi:peptidoglycan hydrolase CwlO-like protein
MNRLFIIIVILTLFVSIVCFAPTAEKNKTYEIETATMGEYKTDASRAIEAYERLMDKYMSLNETYLANMSKEISVLSAKVDGINQQLAQISEKLDRIQEMKSPPMPPPIQPQPSAPQISQPSQ